MGRKLQDSYIALFDRQEELFAEALDRCDTHKKKIQHALPSSCERSLAICEEYHRIAKSTWKELVALHGNAKSDTASSLSTASVAGRSSLAEDRSSSNLLTSKKLSTVEDLQKWEHEMQTWDLIRALVVEGQKPFDQDQSLRDNTFPSEAPSVDAWQQYLSSDAEALTRHIVVEWLKKCSADSHESRLLAQNDIESSVLSIGAVSSQGWLATRETIKARKRLEPRGTSLSGDAEFTKSVRSLSNKNDQLVVTELDPDCVTRQGLALEKQDIRQEERLWKTCWELLRSGSSCEAIADQLRRSSEHWRAVAILGNARVTGSSLADRRACILWRQSCVVASQADGINQWERALYGALGGHFNSVRHVSQTWSDHLFAYYNTYLIRSYDQYLRQDIAQAYRDQISHLPSVAHDNEMEALSPQQILDRLGNDPITSHEARSPFNTLHGSIITRRLVDYLLSCGRRIRTDRAGPQYSDTVSKQRENQAESVSAAAMNTGDEDFLRILTHLILLTQDLGYMYQDEENRSAIEAVIIAYIEQLGSKRKHHLLPLYASKICSDSALQCLGRQLSSVQFSQDRMTVIKLLDNYGIDTAAVLLEYIKVNILEESHAVKKKDDRPIELSILEKPEDAQNQICRLRPDFLMKNSSDHHQQLVNAFQWFLDLNGRWHESVAVGTVIYKHLLRSGDLAAGCRMARETSLRSIFRKKTEDMFGQSYDLGQSIDHNSQEIAELLSQADTFRDLESIFIVLNAVDEWRILADKIQLVPTDKDARAQLRKAFSAVLVSFKPLFRSWVEGPVDRKAALRCCGYCLMQADDTKIELERIRIVYLPEIVLAYISIMNFSAYYLRREILEQSMELAAEIARNSSLASCLASSGRMPSIVDAFAIVARSMMHADQKRPHTSSQASRLAIWSLT